MRALDGPDRQDPQELLGSLHRHAVIGIDAQLHVRGPNRGLRRQHLAAHAQGFNAGGQVHSRSHHAVLSPLPGADRAGDYVTRAQANSHLQRWQPLLGIGLIHLFHGDLHCQGAGNGGLGMISADQGCPKKHENGITLNFVDRAAVVLDDLKHLIEIVIEQLHNQGRMVVVAQ